MATTKYFTLSTTDTLGPGDTPTLSKKFRSLLDGYRPQLEKSQSITKTIDGKLDISLGGIYESLSMSVRVRETEIEDGYGSKSDLEQFFKYTDPNGTPSSILKFTDHYGTDHNVVMLGNFSPQHITVVIEGEEAWSYVQCNLQFIP